MTTKDEFSVSVLTRGRLLNDGGKAVEAFRKIFESSIVF
jgi:hypothetical protein